VRTEGRAAIGATLRDRYAPGAKRTAYRHWDDAPGWAHARCGTEGVSPVRRHPLIGTRLVRGGGRTAIGAAPSRRRGARQREGRVASGAAPPDWHTPGAQRRTPPGVTRPLRPGRSFSLRRASVPPTGRRRRGLPSGPRPCAARRAPPGSGAPRATLGSRPATPSPGARPGCTLP